MKLIRHILPATVMAACTIMLLGCASTSTSTQNKESMLVASGFKVITPKTAAQQQKLQNLPPGKVTMIQKGGKTYYIFRTQLTTAPMSVDPGSIRLINSSARQINLQRRTWKPLRRTRTRRCSGVYGADGGEALGHGDQWQGRISLERNHQLRCAIPLRSDTDSNDFVWCEPFRRAERAWQIH